MKHKKVKVCAILLLGFGLTKLQAQEAITSTGGNASGSGGSTSYSVGQVIYSTNTGSSGSAIQGVQQPFEISVISGFDYTKGVSLQCSTSPNPTNNNVTLTIDGDIQSIYYAFVYNSNGKLVSKQNVYCGRTIIMLEEYPSSTYFIKVIENNKELKSFKIIKN